MYVYIGSLANAAAEKKTRGMGAVRRGAALDDRGNGAHHPYCQKSAVIQTRRRQLKAPNAKLQVPAKRADRCLRGADNRGARAEPQVESFDATLRFLGSLLLLSQKATKVAKNSGCEWLRRKVDL